MRFFRYHFLSRARTRREPRRICRTRADRRIRIGDRFAPGTRENAGT